MPQQVFSDDELFFPKASDRLPKLDDEDSVHKLYNVGVFDYEAGYILVRAHHLGPWKLSSPVHSYQQCYCELIITAYDAEGTPLWQTTSDIFVA